MPYQLTVEQRPTYLHARATGERTPENARRFLKEAYAACVGAGQSDLLLEMQFEGPRLSETSIFDVLSERIPDGLKLRRIAYVDGARDASQAYFAETVAMNRGVNVRYFASVAEAATWLGQR